ncbi:hypothetical protein ACHAWF_003684 [Thalassiosira exigua]
MSRRPSSQQALVFTIVTVRMGATSTRLTTPGWKISQEIDAPRSRQAQCSTNLHTKLSQESAPTLDHGTFPLSDDGVIAKTLGPPIHTSCCPSGTVEFLVDKNVPAVEGCCGAVAATLEALTSRMSTHAPNILILTGSLRAESYCRKLAIEAGRILASYGAEVKRFDASGLPLFSQDIETSNEKIDWMPLTEGAIRPTQGKTCAVMHLEAGSQTFNTVNNLRVLGRWMRMVVIPNQISITRAYQEFTDEGMLKDSPLKSHVVDVVDELFRYILMLRDKQPLLLQRYSERTAAAAKKNLKDTCCIEDPSVLRSLKGPIIIDVRSEKEVKENKGGRALPGSIHAPLNVDGNPQNVHQTTAQEFHSKLVKAGLDMEALSKSNTNFITHCTKRNTEYTGRCNRAVRLYFEILGINMHTTEAQLTRYDLC